MDERDEIKMIRTVREKLSQIVSNEPEKFVDIFEGGKTELEEWTKKIRKLSPEKSMEKWGGATEFKIFTCITGICVHVINKENQDIEPPIQHFLPRSIPKVKWTGQWVWSLYTVMDTMKSLFLRVFQPSSASGREHVTQQD